MRIWFLCWSSYWFIYRIWILQDRVYSSHRCGKTWWRKTTRWVQKRTFVGETLHDIGMKLFCLRGLQSLYLYAYVYVTFQITCNDPGSAPFSSEHIFDALVKTKKIKAVKGNQEDAEEFLGHLLNGIHDEMVNSKFRMFCALQKETDTASERERVFGG